MCRCSRFNAWFSPSHSCFMTIRVEAHSTSLFFQSGMEILKECPVPCALHVLAEGLILLAPGPSVVQGICNLGGARVRCLVGAGLDLAGPTAWIWCCARLLLFLFAPSMRSQCNVKKGMDLSRSPLIQVSPDDVYAVCDSNWPGKGTCVPEGDD